MQGSVRLSGVTLTDADVLIVKDRRNLMLAGQDAVLDRENNVAANIATALPWDKSRRRVGRPPGGDGAGSARAGHRARRQPTGPAVRR